MEKKTYLILHATESPISGATHPLQKINYAVGLIEKDKFQSFIEEYKKTLKEYITNNIQISNNINVNVVGTYSVIYRDNNDADIHRRELPTRLDLRLTLYHRFTRVVSTQCGIVPLWRFTVIHHGFRNPGSFVR